MKWIASLLSIGLVLTACASLSQELSFRPFLLSQMAGQQKAAEEITILITGQSNGPILVQWLQQQRGVEVTLGPSDVETALCEHKNEFVLVIDKVFYESSVHPAARLYS